MIIKTAISLLVCLTFLSCGTPYKFISLNDVSQLNGINEIAIYQSWVIIEPRNINFNLEKITTAELFKQPEEKTPQGSITATIYLKTLNNDVLEGTIINWEYLVVDKKKTFKLKPETVNIIKHKLQLRPKMRWINYDCSVTGF